ncbi:Sucrase/ferredoxin-like-domain-containing protein [Gaertneriomyces semiglobifer]|nr:Sucrase/ferredoxin-like-domain-containing protein [Gaertneriomyces semiglobifer]
MSFIKSLRPVKSVSNLIARLSGSLPNSTDDLSKSSNNQAPSDVEPPSDKITPFTGDPCSGCSDPCSSHPQLPDYLRNKIEGGPLINTMKPYARHIFVVEGVSNRWPERIEESTRKDDGVQFVKVVYELAQGISESGKAKGRTIVTAADPDGGAHQVATSEGQLVLSPRTILVFPQNVAISPLADEDANELIESLLVSDTLLTRPGITTIPLPHLAYIFVCTHKKRDKRCGVAGPMLVAEFRKAAEEMDLQDEVQVLGCSHFGGHKYAGNIIIYHKDPRVSGIWYGRVKTCDVRNILHTTIVQKRVFKELFRGRMEMPAGAITDSETPSNRSSDSRDW